MGVPKLKVDAVDYERTIIEKMQESKPDGLALAYKYGDVTNLEDTIAGQYNYAIDKGTLHAIAVDDTEETIKKCHKYFNEMIRVIKKDSGTFFIVSLLQPHVFKILLDFFMN